MPYDPTHPINGEIADAGEIRAQFSSFDERITEANERIDNIPAGPRGMGLVIARGAAGG